MYCLYMFKQKCEATFLPKGMLLRVVEEVKKRKLFFVSPDAFLLLAFHAPVFFALSLHSKAVPATLRQHVSAIAGDVSIECFGSDFVFFKFLDVEV